MDAKCRNMKTIRREIYILVNEKKASLNSEEVVSLSQELDKLVIEQMRHINQRKVAC